MDRKTLIGLGLIMAIVVVYMQFFLFPETEPIDPEVAETLELADPRPEALSDSFADFASPINVADEQATFAFTEPIAKQTDLFDIVFDPQGGSITSLRLREHADVEGRHVDLVVRPGQDRFFDVVFGDYRTEPLTALFDFEQLDAYTFQFSRVLLDQNGAPFTLTKRYHFAPGSYLFQVSVEIDHSLNEFPALDFDGIGYTLAVAPQIGPEYGSLGGGLFAASSAELREFWNFTNGKAGSQRFPRGQQVVTERKHVTWSAIVGKYFAVIAEPAVAFDQVTYDARPDPEIDRRGALYFSRPPLTSSRNEDTFRVYAGPRNPTEMVRYNESDPFGGGGHEFERAVSRRPLIGWLSNLLRGLLDLLYRLIPNYGVAIILMTILIKAILFPLTKKSMESTAKMGALSPKINALREKHKGNPQKMNQEMAQLYKKEGVNPAGGCLPILLQMPIFFALFDLLSTNFDLRGAVFIASWIADLSSPETLFSIGGLDVRILPFVMSGSQLFQTRLTQSNTGSQRQMKFMMYGLPIVFFFILYGMPSGLVVYWTMQNFLSIGQQLYFNEKRKRDAAGGSDSAGKGGGGKKPPTRSK